MRQAATPIIRPATITATTGVDILIRGRLSRAADFTYPKTEEKHMKNAKQLIVGLALCAAGASANAGYVTSQSEAMQLSSGKWRYSFSVTNAPDSPGAIRGVSVNLLFSDIFATCSGKPGAWDCNGGLSFLFWDTGSHPEIYIYPGQTTAGFAFDADYAPIRFSNSIVVGVAAGISERLPILGPGSPQALAALGIPEPSTLLLAAVAVVGMGLGRRNNSQST